MPNFIKSEKGYLSLPIIIAITALVLLFGLICYFLFFNNKSSSLLTPSGNIFNKASTISGKIDLNGVAPSGSTISIGVRQSDKANFNIIASNIQPSDGALWSFDQAKSGSIYQIQAFLEQNNQTVASSDIINVAAPAIAQVLRLNIVTSGVYTSSSQAAISGTLDINGYVPPGSTVSIQGKKKGESVYKNLISNLPAIDGTSWKWNDASSGVTYEIKAVLYNKTTVLTQSEINEVTAPSANESLRLVSSSQAPANQTTSVMSGIVMLNGIAPSGSSIVILQRPVGTTAYTVAVSGLAAQNGVNWSWNGGKSGVSYNILAVLKQSNGSDLAYSNTLTTAPPAANEILVINSSIQQPAPSNPPSISCQGQQNNLWAANVTVNYIIQNNQNAAQYWVRVGDGNSDNRYLDTRFTAQNQSGQTQQVVQTPYVLGSGGTYFAKYAYSYSSTSGNLSDFSAWSNVTTFSCPQSQPTSTPTPTYTPTPTPTLAPYTSTCNQSCGGNGYTCITGLQCVDSAEIGGNVCRNPNCTASTNCICQ